MSTINLDGGEISIIRALGFAGTQVAGHELKGKVGSMSERDLIECLKTLIALGFVSSSADLDRSEEFDKMTFAVNSGYSRDLREAIDPQPKSNKRQRRV
jgi:hypothetical protein